jgi:hypothetical protein
MSGAPSGRRSTAWCTTRAPRRVRAPDRTTDAKSLERRIRFTDGSTAQDGASGGKLAAALTTTGRDDRAAGPSAHAQPESVRLCPAAVVRLKGALAHGRTPSLYEVRRRTGDSWVGLQPELACRRNDRMDVREDGVHGTDRGHRRSNRGVSSRTPYGRCSGISVTTRRRLLPRGRGAVNFADRVTLRRVTSGGLHPGDGCLYTVCGQLCGSERGAAVRW